MVTETKYYISTLEDSEVKAYCIMSDKGLVMACEQMYDDKKFYEDVDRLCKLYNCVKIEDVTPKGQEQIDKVNSRTYATIPNISVSISNYLKTDEGKELVIDYIKSVDDFDYGLLYEIVNYKRGNK